MTSGKNIVQETFFFFAVYFYFVIIICGFCSYGVVNVINNSRIPSSMQSIWEQTAHAEFFNAMNATFKKAMATYLMHHCQENLDIDLLYQKKYANKNDNS